MVEYCKTWTEEGICTQCLLGSIFNNPNDKICIPEINGCELYNEDYKCA